MSRRTVATTSEAEAPVDSNVSPTRMARSMTARAVTWSTPSAPCHRYSESVGGPMSRTARPARARSDLPATREDRGGCGSGVISDTSPLLQSGGAEPNAPWHDVRVSEEQHQAEH